MAQLAIETDLFTPGTWRVRSDSPAALAATCDALVQGLGLEGEVLAAWALHYDEQGERVEDAYVNERTELGHTANAQVVVLPRPVRGWTVWLDRIHLVVSGARPATGTRLLGLYVSELRAEPRSGGDLVVSVHHPSVAAQVAAQVAELPDSAPEARAGHSLVANSRFVVSVDRHQPGSVLVLAPQPMALAVQDSLTRLQGLVAPW